MDKPDESPDCARPREVQDARGEPEPNDLDRRVSSEARADDSTRSGGEPARLRSGKEYHRERQDHEAVFGFIHEYVLNRLDGRPGRADDYLPASATDPGIVYEYKQSNLESQAARNTLSRNIDRHARQLVSYRDGVAPERADGTHAVMVYGVLPGEAPGADPPQGRGATAHDEGRHPDAERLNRLTDAALEEPGWGIREQVELRLAQQRLGQSGRGLETFWSNEAALWEDDPPEERGHLGLGKAENELKNRSLLASDIRRYIEQRAAETGNE